MNGKIREKSLLSCHKLCTSDFTLYSLPFCIHRLCALQCHSGRMFSSSLTETKEQLYFLCFKTLSSCKVQLHPAVFVPNSDYVALHWHGTCYKVSPCPWSGFAQIVSSAVHCVRTLKQIFSWPLIVGVRMICVYVSSFQISWAQKKL